MLEPEVKDILKEFVRCPEWERIKEVIGSKIGASYSWLVDIEGNFIYRKLKDKEFCQMVKGKATGEKKCHRSFLFSLSQSRKNRLPAVTICEAGFLQFACPILISKEVIGIIGGCQIVNADLDTSSYRTLAQSIGLAPEQFLVAIGKDNQPGTLDILEIEAELITLLAQSTVELIFKKSQLIERDEEIKGISESYQLFGSSRQSILNLGRENLYSLIVNMVSRAMGAEICSLMMKEEGSEELTMKAAIGLDVPIVSRARIKIGEGIVGYVVKTGQPLLVEDIDFDTRFKRTYKSSRYYTKSLLAAPVKIGGQVVGAISVNNKATHGAFDQKDLGLFTQICQHVSLAMENLRPYPSEEKKAKTGEIERLGNEAEQLGLLCNVKREEIKTLQEQVQELEEKSKTEEAVVKEYARQIEALRKETEEVGGPPGKMIAEIKAELEKVQAKADEEGDRARRYAQQMESLKKESEEAGALQEEVIAEIKAELEEAKAKVVKEEGQAREYAQQIAEVDKKTGSRENLQEEIESLRAKAESEGLKVKAQAEQLEELSSRLEEMEILRAQIKELKQQHPLEDTPADKLRLRTETAEITVGVQEKELKELRGQIRQMRLNQQVEELERLKKETATMEELKEQTVLIKELRAEAEEKGALIEKKEIEEIKTQKDRANLLYEVKKEIERTMRLEAEAKEARDEEKQKEHGERLKELRTQEEELEKLRIQTKELNFLYRFSKEIGTVGQPKEVLTWVLEQIQDYLSCQITSYLIARPQGLRSAMRAVCQMEAQIIEEIKTKMVGQWLEWNPKRRKEAKRQISLTIEVLQEEKKAVGLINSFLIAPIKEEDKVIGVLSAAKLNGQNFTPLEQRLFTIIGDLVSVSLERARLFMEMQEAAEKDELTGAYNFRYFDKFFQREFALATRYHQPLSLIMLDFDHLKYFNDTFGHQEGNRLIKTIAYLIQKSVRLTDWVVRFGGDEFGVVLSQTNQDEAMTTGERIRELIANHVMMVKGEPHQLTASLGVATYNREKGVDTKTIISQADHALYQAKELGRNRVCKYGVEDKSAADKLKEKKHEWRDIIKVLFESKQERW